MALPPEKRQGYLGNLEEKSIIELEELLKRQENLLNNRNFLNSLKDKGRKVEDFAARLRSLIRKKIEVDDASLQFDRMTLSDDDQIHKLGEKISTRSTRIVKNAENLDHVNKMEAFEEKSTPKDLYHPNRTLRVETVVADMKTEFKKGVTDGSYVEEYQPKKENLEDISIPQLSEETIAQLEQHIPFNVAPFEPQGVDLSEKSNKRFVVYEVQSNGVGANNTELCQLVATGPDQRGFNRYCIPPYLSKQIAKFTGLRIEYERGQRVLTKHAESVVTVDKHTAVKDFKRFVDEIQTICSSENDGDAAVVLCTSSLASQNTLLYNFKTCGLYPPSDVYFAYSTPLLTSLKASGKTTDSTLSGAFSCLFYRKMNIWDAKSRCDSLRRILFDSSLELSSDEVVRGCATVDCSSATEYLDRLLEKRKRVNSMRGKLFDFSLESKNVITEGLAEAIANAGLNYESLERYYRTGKQAFVGILALPGSNSRGRPRVTDDLDVLKALLNHFQRKSTPKKYDGALVNIQTTRAVHLPLSDSLELQITQKAKLDEIAVKHAAERLANPIPGVGRMVRFNPDRKNPAELTYREVKDISDSDDDLEAMD
ncbi:uncharacterized protein LOC141905627 [Tubulanus polymorphus]|uniref:uncharacterized protein LOC141905627 n=1 Tax=Tubulanus polymorphus TaxID=672921 RepID=UPI003DA6B95B